MDGTRSGISLRLKAPPPPITVTSVCNENSAPPSPVVAAQPVTKAAPLSRSSSSNDVPVTKRVEYPNKDVYEGEFLGNVRHGKGRFEYSSSGSTYVGMWKNGVRCGEGVFTFSNGDKYEGQWQEDRRHGHGKMVFCSDDGHGAEEIYVGDWYRGKMHGSGKFTAGDGGVYDGEWVDGMMQGYGTYEFPTGNRYAGEWVKNTKEGIGTLVFANGERYDGEWLNDMANGVGTLIDVHGDKYVGLWANGKRHGQGEIYYQNGDTFSGEFQHGMICGHGTIKFRGGERYEGLWHNDKRDGRGMFHWTNGAAYSTVWKSGRRHGRGRYISTDGVFHEEEWHNGTRIFRFPHGKGKSEEFLTNDAGDIYAKVTVEQIGSGLGDHDRVYIVLRNPARSRKPMLKQSSTLEEGGSRKLETKVETTSATDEREKSEGASVPTGRRGSASPPLADADDEHPALKAAGDNNGGAVVAAAEDEAAVGNPEMDLAGPDTPVSIGYDEDISVQVGKLSVEEERAMGGL